MVHLWSGLVGAAVGAVIKKKEKDMKRKGKPEEDRHISETKSILFAYAASAIQGVVLFVVLCPVAMVYVFGLGISAGASLWRLIKHDFGDDGGANKKPALQVLYSLAVAQGVLFGYKMIHAIVTKGGLVKLVYDELDKGVPEKLVAEYLEETVAGCEKDPSFATGRNFVTYGVNLMMEAKSSEAFIAGIKVLGGAISDESGRKVLAKYLLTKSDDSSSSIVQRLLETVGPRSPYSREIKEHVVRILDIICPCIRLERFPRAIECLCSVVDTSGDSQRYAYEDTEYSEDYDCERADRLLEYYEKEYIKKPRPGLTSRRYGARGGRLRRISSNVLKKLSQCLPCKTKEVESEREESIRGGLDRLLIRATNIIYKLVAREDNIWILRTCVSDTVLHKIATLPLKLHKDNNHDPYCLSGSKELMMIAQCWVVTQELMMALHQRREENNQEIKAVEEDGNTVLLLRRSIESTIKSIFDCLDCSATQKRQAIQILLHLSLDMSIIKDSESNKRRLSWILLLILCIDDDDSERWMVPSLTYPNNNHCDFNGVRRLAGKKLSKMLKEKHELPPEETATEIQLVGLALRDLKSAFDDDSEDISIRTYAIIIMEDLLCVHHTSYSEVKEFLRDAFPKVVKETVRVLCDSKTEVTDVEQRGLQKALALSCHNIYHNYLTINFNFKEIASRACEEQGKSFEDFIRLINQSVSNTQGVRLGPTLLSEPGMDFSELC